MQKIANMKRLPFFGVLFLWGAFFVTIGSGCFQMDYRMPFLIPVFSLLSKMVFAASLFIHIAITLKKKEKTVTKYDILLLCFFVWQIVSSVMNGHVWITLIPFIMKTLSVRFMLSLGLVYDKRQIIGILSSAFSFIVYLNFFFLLLFPAFFGYYEGSEVYLISTNYNQFGALLIPAIFLNALHIFCGNKNVRRLLPLILISFLSVAIEGSATASVALALLAVSVAFIKNPRLLRIEYLAVFIGILLFFITFVIPVFSILDIPAVNRIVEGLGKDMTFSRRTEVWLYADFQISHSPIIGYGVCDGDLYHFLLGNFVNPHNIILHILMQGGVIGLIIFAIFVSVGIRRICSIANMYQRNLIMLISVIFFLMSQFEVYNNMFVYMYILFMYISADYSSQPKLSKSVRHCDRADFATYGLPDGNPVQCV